MMFPSFGRFPARETREHHACHRVFLALAFGALFGGAWGEARAQTTKAEYLRLIERAAEAGWREYPAAIERWKQTTKPSELWGYDAPGHPIYLADLLAFLYQETKVRVHAERVRDILASYGDLRSIYPKEQQAARVEYRNGVPAISNFFILPPYARAFMRIRGSDVLDGPARQKIERDLAYSLDHIFHFPEWGAHNRAMLRAESLYYGAVALPAHPNAARWRQLAETLARDNLAQWEIEDATGYHAVWLYSLFSYAEVSGRADVLRSVQAKYYLDYFVQLLTPHGNIADFGDANWNGGWERFVPVFERAATLYRDPRYKYVARRLVGRALDRMKAAAGAKPGDPLVDVGVGVASALADAYRWADDAVSAETPVSGTQDVLDDLVGKKVVFRNGWGDSSTMMLLNYRDEGDGGRLGRDYLRQNLSVEEEKMHHGHADENSIALLMSGGSVLLHDAGYRSDLPSGPFGAFRADYFHNRVVVRKNRRDKGQAIYEFLRNSGAYRPVRTQKLDLLTFKEVDSSRTRVIDEELGYEWDRVVTWLRNLDLFVVIDGVKALRGDYFTFTNLWHTRKVLGREGATFETAYDRIQGDVLPAGKSLRVQFLGTGAGRQTGMFELSRHFQDEVALYQTVSSSYRAGDREVFVTVLAPHGPGADAGRYANVRLIGTDRPGQAVGIELEEGGDRLMVGVRLDLEMPLAREDVRPRHRPELGTVRYGDLETDASYVFARIGAGQVAYAAATMTGVRYRGQPLMSALPTTFGLQLDGAPPRTGFAVWRSWEDVVKVSR
jgi:hypothetical protein